ncbi:MAG TPA: site-2 protease family protein [Gemmatimonadales bacterium]|nr:site-2 protease family protein [Gemmatimonadales bacterium]
MSLLPYLRAWRTTPLHDREVIDGLVDRVHEGPSQELAAALARWPGTYYWSDEPDGRHIVLTRPNQKAREAWGIHAVLFLAALVMMTISGGALSSSLPQDMSAWTPEIFVHGLSRGLSFSLPLIAILLCHELGHYLTARRYQLNVSPPFFIPGLVPPYGIGTFGAFIRLRTIVNDRRQLLDVGAAGPIAGFIVAVPVLWLGFLYSHVVAEPPEGVRGMFVSFGNEIWPLGDSIITFLIRHASGRGAAALALSPMALAGWFGIFVTMLNLLPMAQLDGGHILYAAFPSWHRRVARLFWLATLALSWISLTWLFWGVLVLILSRGRLDHPPVLDAYRPLPRSRRWLVWISLVLFIATFIPAPFRR